MSIIAVTVPVKMSLKEVVKILAGPINGNFEALNFEPHNKNSNGKTCYLRLSEKLDPLRILEKINFNAKLPKKLKMKAFIPDTVPDLPLASKPKTIPNKIRKALNLPQEHNPGKVINWVSRELLVEMQLKYPGLCKISIAYQYEPIDDLTKIILTRLRKLSGSNNDIAICAFKLSQEYRRVHPHTNDFPLMVSIIHKIQTARGETKSEIDEKEMSIVPHKTFFAANMPMNKLKQVIDIYSDRVMAVIREHIQGLRTEISCGDTEEDSARKKVREELIKMSPFLRQFVKEVVTRNFVPHKIPNHKMRMYGEPFLPKKEVLMPFLKRYGTLKADRSDRIYNLIKFSIPPDNYSSIMAMNGTVINGAKITIRSSNLESCYLEGGTVDMDDDQGGNVEDEEGQDMDLEDY